MKPYQSILKCLKLYPLIVENYNHLTLKLNKPQSFQHQQLMGNICTLYHFLKTNVSDLYHPSTTAVVKYFTDQFQIQATRKHIWLSKQINASKKLKIKLYSIPIEQRDHPYHRKTLYFKQLKDIQKHLIIERDASIPPPLQQVRKSYLQEVVLDRQNPYGLPKHTPKLYFQLLIENIWLKMQMWLGDVKLRNLSFIKQNKNQHQLYFSTPALNNTLTFQKIPQKTQKAIFDLLTNEIKIGQPQLLMIHKLGFVGGNFARIQNLINALNFLIQFEKQRYKI